MDKNVCYLPSKKPTTAELCQSDQKPTPSATLARIQIMQYPAL